VPKRVCEVPIGAQTGLSENVKVGSRKVAGGRISVMSDDWRIQNQGSYLTGQVSVFRRWSTDHGDLDHDHCSFCWVHFAVTILKRNSRAGPREMENTGCVATASTTSMTHSHFKSRYLQTDHFYPRRQCLVADRLLRVSYTNNLRVAQSPMSACSSRE